MSRDEFTEFIAMRSTIRLFVNDAKCLEMLIEVLAGLVAAHWKVVGDDDTSVVDKTVEVYRYICTDMCTDIIRRHLRADKTTGVYRYICTDMCTDIT